MWKNRSGYILVMAVCAVLLFLYSEPFLLYTVLTAGYALLEIKIHNQMFATEEQRRILLKLGRRQDNYEIPVEAGLCGEVRIDCENVWFYDMFKLFRCRGKRPEQIRTVIYPKDVNVNVEMNRNFVGVSQEEEMIQNRKGNDPSETFDIREYVPGDDVRSIHWELSSKTDTWILREASDPTHYQVVMMPDFGLDQLEKEESGDEINMAAALGDALCRQFVRKGISFCMAFPTGNGLKLFMTEHLEQCFTKLVILSTGQFEQNLGSLDGQISVTVLNVSSAHQEMNVSRNGTCEITGFPAVQESNTTYRIMC